MYTFRIELFRCPFCRPGEGVVSADPARIPKGEEPPLVGEPASYLWFSTGAAGPEPCAHLVYMDLEAGRTGVESHDASAGDGYDYVHYRHPALQAADPRHALLGRLCVAMPADPTTARRPDTPFEFQQKFVAGAVIGPGGLPVGEWSVSADVAYAADAPRFVRECVALGYGTPRSRRQE